MSHYQIVIVERSAHAQRSSGQSRRLANLSKPFFFFFKVNARSVRGLHKSIPAIFDEFTVFALFPHIQFKGYR